MNRFDVAEEPNLQQLRDELKEALSLDRAPSVHYYPDVGKVEVDSNDTRVPGIVAGHAPDRRRRLSPGRRELLELIEEREGGELPEDKRDRLYSLLLEHVKRELGG